MVGVTPTQIASVQNSGTFTAGTSVTVTSATTVPAGALQVVFLRVGGSSTPSAITAPGGWTTTLASTADGSGATAITGVFSLRAPAPSASFSGSFTWTGTATSGRWLFTAWDGVGAGNIDGTAQTTQNASGTNTSPTITPGTGLVNDCLICGFFAGTSGTSTITVPAGMATVFTGASSAGQGTFGVASLGLTSASATGVQTWTIGTSHLNMGLSFLIQQGPAWGWTSAVDDRSAELIRVLNTPLVVSYDG